MLFLCVCHATHSADTRSVKFSCRVTSGYRWFKSFEVTSLGYKSSNPVPKFPVNSVGSDLCKMTFYCFILLRDKKQMTRVRHYLKFAFFEMLNKEAYLSKESNTLPKASPSVSHNGLQKARIQFLS